MMEVVVTTGAIKRAELQSHCHHQQINTKSFTGQMPFHRPTNSVRALKGNHLTNELMYVLCILFIMKREANRQLSIIIIIIIIIIISRRG